MPDGLFYKIDDEHIESVRDISYSISSDSEPSVEWFLITTGAVRLCCYADLKKKYLIAEYYILSSTQKNVILDVINGFGSNCVVEIDPHEHRSAKHLKRIIDNEIECVVKIYSSRYEYMQSC